MACEVAKGHFAMVVQGILLLVSLTALLCKYKLDKTGRGWFQFLVDSSKQLAGAGWMHMANLLVAAVLGGGESGADPCLWYWLEIMCDCTVGVWIEAKLLHFLIEGLKKCNMHGLAKDIIAPIPSLDKLTVAGYAKQLFIWLLIVTGMKFVMTLIIMAEKQQLMFLAENIVLPLRHLAPSTYRDDVELLIAMVVTPAFMNSLQFWLVDNIFLHNTALPTKQDMLNRSREIFTKWFEEHKDLEVKNNAEVREEAEKQFDEFYQTLTGDGKESDLAKFQDQVLKLLTDEASRQVAGKRRKKKYPWNRTGQKAGRPPSSSEAEAVLPPLKTEGSFSTGSWFGTLRPPWSHPSADSDAASMSAAPATTEHEDKKKDKDKEDDGCFGGLAMPSFGGEQSRASGP